MPTVTSSCPKACLGAQLLALVRRNRGRGNSRCKCLEGGSQKTPLGVPWGWGLVMFKMQKELSLIRWNLFIRTIFFLIYFFQLHLQHMEVLRLGVNQSCSCWPQPQQYQIQVESATYAAACSNECQVLNPLSEARDRTHILRTLCWVLNRLNHNRNSHFLEFIV